MKSTLSATTLHGSWQEGLIDCLAIWETSKETFCVVIWSVYSNKTVLFKQRHRCIQLLYKTVHAQKNALHYQKPRHGPLLSLAYAGPAGVC